MLATVEYAEPNVRHEWSVLVKDPVSSDVAAQAGHPVGACEHEYDKATFLSRCRGLFGVRSTLGSTQTPWSESPANYCGE